MEGDNLQLLLVSSEGEVIEDLKKKFYEQLNSTKEPYLLNDLFECYIQTSSMNLVEVLVGVREPHDRHLFDKLSDTLSKGGSSKMQALHLLGHVVRRHPTWLIKITQHQLLKDLLKLLKNETNILHLVSALLIVVILLPMMPSLMAPHVQEIFDVFSRLAAWNTINPNKVPEENLLHLQIGLCELFQYLYGLYPCNFLAYLRRQYSQRDQLEVFNHTIKPMVCSVRMHPLLVTASQDREIAPNRWKKMEGHDVVVECAKYVLDAGSRDEPCPPPFKSSFRSRSAMDYISHDSPCISQHLSGRSTVMNYSTTSVIETSTKLDTFWSPSIYCGVTTPPPQESAPTSIPHTPVSQGYVNVHPEGTSPPEAAIEATPETTPIKDLRHASRHPPMPSGVLRALNHSLSSGGVGSSTVHKWSAGHIVSTSLSQPSSPLKKEPSPFRYSGLGVNVQHGNAATPPPTLSSLALPSSESVVSAFHQPRRDSLPTGSSFLLENSQWESTSIRRRLANMIQDRKQTNVEQPEKQLAPNTAGKQRGSVSNVVLHAATMQLPSSPLRTISSSSAIPPESPIPMEPIVPVPGSRDWPVTRPTPEKNGLRLETSANCSQIASLSPHPHQSHAADSTQEDQEVVEIVRQGEQYRNDTLPVNISNQSQARQCDSIIQDHSQDHDPELEVDECQQESSGSPCTSGGLHMPNAVVYFTQRVHHRMRCHSQSQTSSFPHYLASGATYCGSTGSSPGESSWFPSSGKVRRANSCPEMEKVQMLSGAEKMVHKTVEEKEELEESLLGEEATTPKNSISEDVIVNGCGHAAHRKEMVSESTQTSPCAPYEHLFLSVFSHLDCHNSPAQSPAPNQGTTDCHMFTKFEQPSPQVLLDQYLARVMENREKGLNSDQDVRVLREQVSLLNIQLQFERQRREVYADRNRRLLGRSRTNRALEEHKTALTEQLGLLQHDNERLHQEFAKVRAEARKHEQERDDYIKYLEKECSQVHKNYKESEAKREAMEQQLLHERELITKLQKDAQQIQAKLNDVNNEARQAAASASAAERLRAEVNYLQREMLLAGEDLERYRERIQQFSLLNNRQDENILATEAHHEEINNLKKLLDLRQCTLDATKARVSELETNLTSAIQQLGDQKRQLKCVKDEYNDQLKAVESKYTALKQINQRLQEDNLELLQNRDRAPKKDVREVSASQPAASCSSSSHIHPKSPDSVCSDDRLPHSSSPLSESLSSSEGMSLSGILAKDVVTMQNLQVIIDQPEQTGFDSGQSVSQPNPSRLTSAATNQSSREEG